MSRRADFIIPREKCPDCKTGVISDSSICTECGSSWSSRSKKKQQEILAEIERRRKELAEVRS